MVAIYTTVITDEGKWLVARCIELGVVSQGKTVEEAQKNLKEAVELYLDDAPRMKRSAKHRAPIVTTMSVTYG